jgi:transposase InsO family protein
MDLYSRRIVGWHLDKRMTTDLVNKAVMKAYNLRQPVYGVTATEGHNIRVSDFKNYCQRMIFVQAWAMSVLVAKIMSKIMDIHL